MREKRKEKGEKRKDGEERGGNIMFQNVANLRNNDKDFWLELKKWDVLSKTWINKKGWSKIREKMQEAMNGYSGLQRRTRKKERWEKC